MTARHTSFGASRKGVADMTILAEFPDNQGVYSGSMQFNVAVLSAAYESRSALP